MGAMVEVALITITVMESNSILYTKFHIHFALDRRFGRFCMIFRTHYAPRPPLLPVSPQPPN